MPGFQIVTDQPTKEKDRFVGTRSGLVGPENDTEVGRAHRWLFETLSSAKGSPLGNIKDGILLYAHKCSRPAMESEDVTIHHGQTEIYRPGKIRWGPIQLAFYERMHTTSVDKGVGTDMWNDSAYRLYEWWSKSMIDISTNYTYSPKSYLKDATIRQLDGAGYDVWTYNLYNCWPQKVTPSELDYSNTDLSEITVTLRYDKAEEKAW